MASVGFIVFSIFVAVFLLMLYKAVKTALDYMHRPKPVTMHTDLAVFKESQTVDRRIKRSGHKLKQSPTAIFEDMCLVNPVEAVGLENIAEQYGAIIKGEIADLELKHIPSEFIKGERNPDYQRYLVNQLKIKGHNPWVAEELTRLEGALEHEEIEKGFIETLIGTYRLPVETVPFAISEDRMENFTEKEWRGLAHSVRNYVSEFSLEAVCAFLVVIEDYHILVDYDSMEKYANWHYHGVPMSVSKENLVGNIPDETLIEVVGLVDERAYDWGEALQEVLQNNVALLKEEELRNKYREKAERR